MNISKELTDKSILLRIMHLLSLEKTPTVKKNDARLNCPIRKISLEKKNNNDKYTKISKNDKNTKISKNDKSTKMSKIDNNNPKPILRSFSATSQKLQTNKKYVVIRNTVLIPCTKRKLQATVRVHFSTTTPVEPATRSIRHRSHLLRKSLKLLNAADNYTVAREAHRVANIKWAAIDSGASGNYFPDTYDGGNHDPLAPVVTVGCANDAAIKSTARDTLRHKKLPPKARICHKFKDITTPLISVSQLCQIDMTVTFDKKGVLVNNSEGETVIKGHLDLGSNLYMVPANDEDTYAPTAPRNIVEISQHRVSIAYSIKCVPKWIKYRRATAGFPVKDM